MWKPTSGGIPKDFICPYSSYTMTKFTVYFDDNIQTNLCAFEVEMEPVNFETTGWSPCMGTFGTKTAYLQTQALPRLNSVKFVRVHLDGQSKYINSIQLQYSYWVYSFGKLTGASQTYDTLWYRLIGFKTEVSTVFGQTRISAFQPVENDPAWDCNLAKWTTNEVSLLPTGADPFYPASKTVLIGTPGFDVLFTSTHAVPDCWNEFIDNNGISNDWTSGSSIVKNKDNSFRAIFRTDDVSLADQTKIWSFNVDNVDYLESIESDRVLGNPGTIWTIVVKFVLPSPLLPDSIPQDTEVILKGNIPSDNGYNSNISFYVPRVYYKLSSVKYWIPGDQSTVNGFEPFWTPIDTTLVAKGWTNFSRCLGTCYGILRTITIPANQEIVGLKMCFDADDFKMFEFKFQDGSILTPTSINLSGCLDNTFYTLSGRLIGFKVKTSTNPPKGDGYANIRQIQLMVNTNDCITTKHSLPIGFTFPQFTIQRLDPMKYENIPAISNTVQISFPAQICEPFFTIDKSGIFELDLPGSKLSYYSYSQWSIGIETREIVLSDSNRNGAGFFALGYTISPNLKVVTNLYEPSTFTKTTYMLPGYFITNGQTKPKMTMVEINFQGEAGNIRGVRFTFDNGIQTTTLQAGDTSSFNGQKTIDGIDGNLYIQIIVRPGNSIPYYIQQIKAGGTTFGLNSVPILPNYAKDVTIWLSSQDQFECGMLAHTDGSNNLASIDFYTCNFDQSMDTKFQLSVNITPCSANCVGFDPTAELIHQTDWVLVKLNIGTQNGYNIWDDFLSTQITSIPATNPNPYLVINFGKSTLVQSVWLQIDQLVMNSDYWNVVVGDSNVPSGNTVCQEFFRKPKTGGAFKCGLTGQYFIIDCYGGCTMAVQQIKIWPTNFMGLNAQVSLDPAVSFLEGHATNKNLSMLTGLGSLSCLNQDTSINLSVNSGFRAGVMFDLQYAATIKEFLILQDVRYPYMRFYVSNTPWTQSVGNTDPANCFVDNGITAQSGDNSRGQTQRKCERTGRYVTVNRSSNATSMGICKVLMFGSWCHNSPLLLSDPEYIWPSTTVPIYDVETLVTGLPMIDEGCVLPEHKGYDLQFYDQAGQLLTWIGYNRESNNLLILLNFDQFIPYSGKTITVLITILPDLPVRQSLFGQSMTIQFADISAQLCNYTTIYLKHPIPNDFQLTTSANSSTPVFYNFPESTDTKSVLMSPYFDCGPYTYTLVQNPTFLKAIDPKKPRTLQLLSTSLKDVGLQIVEMQVKCQNYPNVSALTVQIPCKITDCQVQSIMPVDLNLKPSPVFFVASNLQTFRISRFKTNPTCIYIPQDFQYSIQTKNGQKIPDWISLDQSQTTSLLLVTKADQSVDKTTLEFWFKVEVPKLNYKLEVPFKVAVSIFQPNEKSQLVTPLQTIQILPFEQPEESVPLTAAEQAEKEIKQLQASTNVPSTWTGWEILLEAKKNQKNKVDNKIRVAPVAKIQSISVTGVVIVKFSKPMVILQDLSLLFGELVQQRNTTQRLLSEDKKKHEFKATALIKKRQRCLSSSIQIIGLYTIKLTFGRGMRTVTQEILLTKLRNSKTIISVLCKEHVKKGLHTGLQSNVTELGFSYEANFTDKQTLIIKLYFNSAPCVSSNIDRDALLVQLSSLFIDEEDGLSILAEDQVLKKKIPPQMQLGASAVAIESISQGMQIISGGALASNALMNILLQGSLNQVWGLINNIQMIVDTPLINVQYPANAYRVYAVMITIATFDILPTDKFYPYIFPLPEDDEPFNDKFNDLGFGSLYLVGNFGSALIGVIWLLLCYILYPITQCCKRKKCCANFATKLHSQIFFNGTILLVQEAYLDIMICVLINLKNLNLQMTTFGAGLSTFLSVILLICCLVIPIFTLAYIKPKYAQLEEYNIKSRFESIYEMIDLNQNPNAVLWCTLFCFRRAVFAFALIFTTNPCLQLMAFCFPILAVIIMLGLISPLAEKFDNKIELYDSLTILLLSYCLFLFTDFVPDAFIRYQVGFFMIFLTAQNILINVYLMSKEPVKLLFEKLKYWWTNRERLKKKITIQYVRRKTSAFLKKKSSEFVSSLNILESSLETIREESEEESVNLDIGDELDLRLKIYGKNISQGEIDETQVGKTGSLLTVPEVSKRTKNTKTKPIEKKKSIEIVLPYSNYTSKPLKASAHQYSITLTKLKARAVQVSREGKRKRIKKLLTPNNEPEVPNLVLYETEQIDCDQESNQTHQQSSISQLNLVPDQPFVLGIKKPNTAKPAYQQNTEQLNFYLSSYGPSQQLIQQFETLESIQEEEKSPSLGQKNNLGIKKLITPNKPVYQQNTEQLNLYMSNYGPSLQFEPLQSIEEEEKQPTLGNKDNLVKNNCDREELIETAYKKALQMKEKKQNLRDQIFSKTQTYFSKNKKFVKSSFHESLSASDSNENIDYQSKKIYGEQVRNLQKF